eukprot:gene401-474_t
MEDIIKKNIASSNGSSQRMEVMNMISLTRSKKTGLLTALAKDSLFEL